MHEDLGEVRLKSGETLKIMVVEAPDDEHAGTVLNLLSHKGELRQWQFEEDFAGRAEGLRSRYYLGFLEGRAVANISVWESGVAGNLGHVHTLEAHRRKGICKAVMGAQMEDFRRRGGQILVLGTGYDSAPYRIYHSFGFESMVPGSGAMTYVREPTFFEEYFAPGPVVCEDSAWCHLGSVCALMALPEGDWLRSRGAGKFGPTCYEAAYLDDMRGGQQVRVARTETGAAVAYAVLRPKADWGGQVGLMDLFVHPGFISCTPELLEGLTWPSHAVHCYMDADSPVVEVLTGSDFADVAHLPKLLRRGEGSVDVVLLVRV